MEDQTPAPKKTRVIAILAFSYNKGVPTEALQPGAVIIDCRVLPNTWRERNLRGVSGKDSRVIDWLYVNSPLQVNHLQDQAMDAVRRERVSSVFFGCAHGKHRSVAMATEFSRRLGTASWAK